MTVSGQRVVSDPKIGTVIRTTGRLWDERQEMQPLV
jgi:hypothetical protein